MRTTRQPTEQQKREQDDRNGLVYRHRDDWPLLDVAEFVAGRPAPQPLARLLSSMNRPE